MTPKFKAKTDPEKVRKANKGNQWLQHLEGQYTAPLAVRQKKRQKAKTSLGQQRAIRSK